MNRSLRQLLQDAAAGRDVSARARELLKPKRRGPAKALPGEARQANRERRSREYSEATEAIRIAVFARAGGRCEAYPWIGTTDLSRCPRPATDLHHLEGGVGRRRQRQTVENTRAFCRPCHEEAHRAERRSQ